MPNAREPSKPLSQLEHLVMEIVWRLGSVTTEGVRAGLAERHPIKDSTVRTILSRLEEKGYVTHGVESGVNLYRAVDEPQTVAANSVRQIIERFCGGSVERLLIGMVSSHVVDEKELRRLARLIARRRNTREI